MLILAVAVFFRFWQLDQIPPGLYPDVAINGINATDALKNHDFKIFYPDNNGREGLFINLIALSFWLFGASIWSIKIVAAVFGALTVWGIYLLGRQMFAFLNPKKADLIALLAAFFLAVSFWHVNFSRIGFRAIATPFFLVWAFYFIFKAFNGRQKLSSVFYWLAGGVFFGAGFHTYISYRIAPLILVPILIFQIIYSFPKLRQTAADAFSKIWWKWAIFLAATFIIALPIGSYFLHNPQDFMGRTGQVSVLGAAEPLKTLAKTTIQTFGAFNVHGDNNWRHNYSGQPLLFWPIGIFFLLGLIISAAQALNFKSYREEKWLALTAAWTLLVWFAAMLLPAVLTNEGLPHALRMIGVIPPVFLLAGFGAFWFYQLLKKLLVKNSSAKNKILVSLCVLFLIIIGLAQHQKYFLDWAKRPEVKNEFTQRYVDEANYLNSLPDSVAKYVLINEDGVRVPYPDGLPMTAQTIIFMTKDKANVNYLMPEFTGQIKAQEITNEAVFIPLKKDGAAMEQLRKIFPAGKIEDKGSFEIFKVNMPQI